MVSLCRTRRASKGSRVSDTATGASVSAGVPLEPVKHGKVWYGTVR